MWVKILLGIVTRASFNLHSLRFPPASEAIRRFHHRPLAIEYPSVLQHELNIFIDLARGRVNVLVELAFDERKVPSILLGDAMKSASFPFQCLHVEVCKDIQGDRVD